MKRIPGHRIAALLAWVLGTTGVLGLLLRLTLKDRVAILAVVFYALPPSVVVVVLALSCAVWLALRRRRWAVVSFFVTLVALGVWLETDYVWTAGGDPQAEGLRVVLWNVSRPAEQEHAFVPALQEADAQIMLLVESGGNTNARRQFWQSHFPGYQVYVSDVGMTLLSTYPAFNITMMLLTARACVGTYDLATSIGTMSVVGVDIESDPFVSRKPSIDRVYEIAASKPHPVIVLGDFNTPHTSALFADFRRSFQHAFEESGRGRIGTWPASWPVLALDHIWLSQDFVPLNTTTRRTRHSDHAMVVAEVRLRAADRLHGVDI